MFTLGRRRALSRRDIPRIARRFSAGYDAPKTRVPKGTPEAQWPGAPFSNGGIGPAPTGVWACRGYNRLPGAYSTNAPPAYGAYAYNNSGTAISDGLHGLGLGWWNMYQLQTPESEVLKPAEMLALGDSAMKPFTFESPTDLSYGFPPSAFLGSDKLCHALEDLALRPPAASDPGVFQARRAQYQRRHLGRFNVIFCDGHAESGPAARFFDSRQDAVLRRFNVDNQPHREGLITLAFW